jgi:hypothetical protein
MKLMGIVMFLAASLSFAQDQGDFKPATSSYAAVLKVTFA